MSRKLRSMFNIKLNMIDGDKQVCMSHHICILSIDKGCENKEYSHINYSLMEFNQLETTKTQWVYMMV